MDTLKARVIATLNDFEAFQREEQVIVKTYGSKIAFFVEISGRAGSKYGGMRVQNAAARWLDAFGAALLQWETAKAERDEWLASPTKLGNRSEGTDV